MAAGDLIGDGGPIIAAMRNQELLHRTYGVKREIMLPVITNGLFATQWQVEKDARIAIGGGVVRFAKGQIVTHEHTVATLRQSHVPLRPVG